MAVQTLRAVVQYGTGTAANLPGREVAGKTGTTEQNTDAWFNGFTPQLATSIWMGDPKGRTPMYNVGGLTVFGGTYPARIWAAYTKAALGDAPGDPLPAAGSEEDPSRQAHHVAPAAEGFRVRLQASQSHVADHGQAGGLDHRADDGEDRSGHADTDDAGHLP